jgi:hypothetical protein
MTDREHDPGRRAERSGQSAPGGIELLLTIAAVDEEFAEALFADPSATIERSGVALSPPERAIVLSTSPSALRQMVAKIEPRIPEHDRRAFLERSAAALLTLVGGGIALGATGCPSKGHRPDRPEERETKKKAKAAATGETARPAKKASPTKAPPEPKKKPKPPTPSRERER